MRTFFLGARGFLGFASPSASFFLRGAAFFLPVSTGSPTPLSSAGIAPSSQARWTFSFSPSFRSSHPGTFAGSSYEAFSLSTSFASAQPQCLHPLKSRYGQLCVQGVRSDGLTSSCCHGSPLPGQTGSSPCQCSPSSL